MKRLFRLFALATLLTTLVACGGGGGGGGGLPAVPSGDGTSEKAPGAPTLTMSPEPVKNFQFKWDDVEGETEYRLLENPDGQSGYDHVATVAADATSYSHTVFLPERPNASYILQACNTTCTDSEPVYVDENLSASIGYFKASNTDSDDRFGYSIALAADGNTMAVGAYVEASAAAGIDGDQADNSQIDSGAVYVFTRSAGEWTQQAYLKASNADAGRDIGFGYSVHLSDDGNTLAVGGPYEYSAASGIDGDQSDTSAAGSGAVYVFTRDAGTWTQQAYVKASNSGPDDLFGHSVALSGEGDTLVVGAPFEESNASGINNDQTDNSAALSGAVYVFNREEGSWIQHAYVKAASPYAGDVFGYSVALSADGDTFAVGAPREGAASGAVYVFAREEGAWSEQLYAKASNSAADDRFGVSIALAGNGDTLVVGAVGEDSSASGVDGDEADNSLESSGAVYVYTRDGTLWKQEAYLKAEAPALNTNFGSAVAISADAGTVVVGMPFDNSAATGINGESGGTALKSGAAHVFTKDGGAWVQKAYLKAPNADEQDYFGASVALADDGNTLAVGARLESSNATGVGGDSTNNSSSASGAVYLY
ncbi:histidine kinase [Gilvimarinus sp. F26214L]|uniref:histidine kinase n=1 Tax=Gilvimarinus sp. DZF01 TaxID=3461371 RepID=UPI004046866C